MIHMDHLLVHCSKVEPFFLEGPILRDLSSSGHFLMGKETANS